MDELDLHEDYEKVWTIQSRRETRRDLRDVWILRTDELTENQKEANKKERDDIEEKQMAPQGEA